MASVSDPNGGGGRTRTSDTGLMRPLLCHLSYAAVPGAEQKTYRVTRQASSDPKAARGSIVPVSVPVSFAATSCRSVGLTMWQRSNTARVRCPVTFIPPAPGHPH